MPGLAFELQNSPKWLQEYTQELLNKSRALSAERYQQYGQSSPEQTQVIKNQIERLVESQQQRSKFDIIPFSVTGSSSPVFISPIDLRSIIENPDFAQRVYESTTGHHGTKEEIEDLKQRAVKEYQLNLPKIQKLEEEIQKSGVEVRPPTEQGQQAEASIRKLEETRAPLEAQKKQLDAQQSELQKRILGLKSEADKIVHDFIPNSYIGAHNFVEATNGFKAAYHHKVGQIPEIQKQIDAISTQRQGIDANIGQLSSEIEANRKISSNVPQDLFRRASIEREVNNLQRQRGLIAPMNEMHQRAISMLERSFDDDTMKLAKDELQESRKYNELNAVQPLVMHSLEGPSDEYMNKYVNDYTKDMRKALEDESEEQYLQEIAPKINMSFAQMGAFHSGARNRALQDSLSKHRVKLHREISHLTASARDKAMEHHELQKRRELSAADVLGHATRSEKEGARHQAELLRTQALTKHGMSQINVAALGQVARAKQEQEQHEIDVARHEHQRQLLYPQEQLTREAALLSGLPPPPSQAFTGTLSSGPPAPNLYTIGAGALGSLASNFQGTPQQQRMYKKGGSVRKNYASGGAVESDDIGQEIRKIIQEQREADKSHLQHTSHHNPLQSWLMHVGNEMLTNPSVDPLLSVGRGTAASIEHGNVVKERAANLYDKIQNTRLNQYQVLAAFENMKSNQNFRQQQLGLQKEQMGIQRDNIGLRNQSATLLNQNKIPKSLSASERKTEIDAKKDLSRSIRMKKELNHLGKLVKQTSTGPIIGGIKSILPKTKVDNQIEVGTNKLILDMHQGMKNIPRSEEFLKRLETTKPNRSNYPEANDDALNLMNEGANDIEENSISTLISMGWTPEKIRKQFKINVPEHLLGESMGESMEEIPEQGIEQEDQIIQMIDPEGNPLEVPANQLQAALSRGAIIAQ